MAFVYDESFRPSQQINSNQPYLAADMNDLLKSVHAVLRKISGPPFITDDGSLYSKLPPVLKSHHGGLRSNYAKIWDDTIISYDSDAYGASAKFNDPEIIFGSFFTKPQPQLILEKVMWHEFLHLVVDLPKPMHHGAIDDYIRNRLRLPGEPNPLGTVGLEC